MAEQQIYELVKKLNEFPSLPTVVVKVLEITSNNDSNLYDLLDVIKIDQAFSVSILKIANSAFYGRVRGVGSLKEAISVLGQKEIRNIVISKAMFNRFKDSKNSGVVDINKLWEHSFYCGLFAKIIAEELGKDGSDFFIAGLIHDIGKLIIYFELPDVFEKISNAANNRLSDTFDSELKILGTTHDKIGAILLKKWLFPEQLVEAVMFHHNPFKTDNDNLFPILVNVADALAHFIEQNENEDLEEERLKKLINSEIIDFFKTYKVDLSLGELQKFIEIFEVQKEESSEMLKLLLN